MKVSDVCSKLKCSNLTESQFTYLANRVIFMVLERDFVLEIMYFLDVPAQS